MQRLQDIIKERVLILDGAMGTMIQQRVLEEFGWMHRIAHSLSPLMRLFGLPQAAPCCGLRATWWAWPMALPS